MTETNPLWIGIGLTAQIAFSARFLVQWLLSERARRSLMPIHFWYFSLAGSALLLAYAAHQRDLIIALGQMAGLAIYLRNLELIQRHEGRRHVFFLWPWLGLSLIALAAGWFSHAAPVTHAISKVAMFWIVTGMVGQVLFTGRFVVQLYFSERAQRSVNPIHFWYLSMSGSLLLLAYAIAQRDPVIILGQSFGIIVYLRNLKLIQHHERGDQHGEEETLGETLQADASDAEDAEPISPESEPVAVPRTPTQGL